MKDAFVAQQEGRLTQSELDAEIDEAVRGLIAKEEAHHPPILTDGEYRRVSFPDSAFQSFTGLVPWTEDTTKPDASPPPSVPLKAPGSRDMQRHPVREWVRLVHNQPLEEYRFTSSLTKTPVKVTMLSTDRIQQRFDAKGSRDVYSSVDEFVADLVAAQHALIGGLVEAGCPYVQIDAPSYTAYVDPNHLAEMRTLGEDPDAVLARSIAADDAAIANLPGAVFGIRLCRGNRRGMWHREGSYDAIAERLFNELRHDRFLLEYDSPRAGTFEPLRFVPKGKTVVLGLITTKMSELETRDDLLRRLDEATRFLPLDQLAISPQCGFSSGLGGNVMNEDDQWRKIDAMLETAQAARG